MFDENSPMVSPQLGVVSKMPLGFNEDGSEPAPQGPYYCGAGTGVSIGRAVADTHLAYCLFAGVKIAGVNAEVMPGMINIFLQR